MSKTLIELAVIGAPHGVKGEVRLKSFTADPLAIRSYAPLQLADGRVMTLTAARKQGDMLVVRFAGIDSREAAQLLTNAKLFAPRTALPEPGEDEFYHADLIGLDVFGEDGTVIGRVAALHDFGAGDIVEIRLPNGRSVDVPFTRAAVPVIDVAGGRIGVDRAAAGLLPDADDEDAEKAGA